MTDSYLLRGYTRKLTPPPQKLLMEGCRPGLLNKCGGVHPPPAPLKQNVS